MPRISKKIIDSASILVSIWYLELCVVVIHALLHGFLLRFGDFCSCLLQWTVFICAEMMVARARTGEKMIENHEIEQIKNTAFFGSEKTLLCREKLQKQDTHTFDGSFKAF